MKTQGVSLGPQLLGHARSFNLHCLSKGCGCVHTPKNSSEWIQGQKELRYKSHLWETAFEPTRDDRVCRRQLLFLVSSKLEWVPLQKGSWTPGKFQGILILFFYQAHKTELWFKESHQNTVKGNIHTSSDYFSLCKIKTFWGWGGEWDKWFSLGSKV